MKFSVKYLYRVNNANNYLSCVLVQGGFDCLSD